LYHTFNFWNFYYAKSVPPTLALPLEGGGEGGGDFFGLRFCRVVNGGAVREPPLQVSHKNNLRELAKSPKDLFSVIPAKPVPAGFKPGAGIQLYQRIIKSLDSGFHRSDDFLRDHQSLIHFFFSYYFIPQSAFRIPHWKGFLLFPGHHGIGQGVVPGTFAGAERDPEKAEEEGNRG